MLFYATARQPRFYACRYGEFTPHAATRLREPIRRFTRHALADTDYAICRDAGERRYAICLLFVYYADISWLLFIDAAIRLI